MRPIKRIRTKVFEVKQSEFAAIAKTTQPQVSRWETGVAEPSLAELAAIREEARRRHIRWSDRWFFEMPERVA